MSKLNKSSNSKELYNEVVINIGFFSDEELQNLTNALINEDLKRIEKWQRDTGNDLHEVKL